MPVIFPNSLLLLSVFMCIVHMPSLTSELRHEEVVQNISPGSLVAQSMISTTGLRGLHYG